jgi:hypothetical protein
MTLNYSSYFTLQLFGAIENQTLCWETRSQAPQSMQDAVVWDMTTPCNTLNNRHFGGIYRFQRDS